MFFVGDDGAPMAQYDHPEEPRPPLAERLGIAPTDPPIPDIDQTKSNLVPGMRPGQGVDKPRRTGFHEEILVTLHADPVDSIQTALTSDALSAAAPRLRVDGDSLAARRNELRWTASLRTVLWRRRRAHLRVYGSPSANVTVLTLSPLRPRKVATRTFLRRGMRAMTDLRDDLDQKVKRKAEAVSDTILSVSARSEPEDQNAGMEPRDVIRSVKGPTYELGAFFYFDPVTLERGKELGLDGFRFYFLGRGGVLGDVEPAVIHSAFGYFHPRLVEKIWNSAKEIMPPRETAREFLACGHEAGRRVFAGVEGLDAYVDAAAAVTGAVDDSGLALFAGVRAEPVPDDAPAAAAHHAVLLRELRGSAHIAANAAVGLSTSTAHAIKRPDDVAMFGWEAPPAVTDEDRARHERAERITDDILVPAFSVLTDAQAIALVDGTAAMHAALRSG